MSGSYNTILERFRCHACGVHGDGYALIMEARKCSFADARKLATEMCGAAFTLTSQMTGAPSSQKSRLTARSNPQRRQLIRSRYGRK